MVKTVELKLFPDQIEDTTFIWKRAASKAKASLSDVDHVSIARRSIDARGSRPVYVLRCDVYLGEAPKQLTPLLSEFKDVSQAPAIHIIGAGPAGYFAALRLILSLIHI